MPLGYEPMTQEHHCSAHIVHNSLHAIASLSLLSVLGYDYAFLMSSGFSRILLCFHAPQNELMEIKHYVRSHWIGLYDYVKRKI